MALPSPWATNTGSTPTERQARTGELTPPGMTCWARANSAWLAAMRESRSVRSAIGPSWDVDRARRGCGKPGASVRQLVAARGAPTRERRRPRSGLGVVALVGVVTLVRVVGLVGLGLLGGGDVLGGRLGRRGLVDPGVLLGIREPFD